MPAKKYRDRYRAGHGSCDCGNQASFYVSGERICSRCRHIETTMYAEEKKRTGRLIFVDSLKMPMRAD